MSVWFTADTHFGHGNIIKYCQRPFLSPEEFAATRDDPRSKLRISPETVRRHDNALLDSINSIVALDDVLWIVGDFCWGGHADAMRYRNRIRCRTVNLVWGNHDQSEIASAFNDCMDQGMIEVEGQPIWLNHYPMRSWDRAFHGSWQLYGHVHGRLEREDAQKPTLLTKDVGVDACDYRPWSFAQLRTYMTPRIVAFEKQRAAFIAGKDDGSLAL